MNQIESMRIFAKVAQCLNFSDAARQLGISNSAVTRGLSALEQRLNLRLLNRTTRHVSLTAVGRRYLQGCHDVLTRLDTMEACVRTAGTTMTGELKLAAPACYAETTLPALLADFRRDHPAVSFDLTVYETTAQITPENFEVCIMIDSRLRDSSLVCRSIGRSKDLIVASPSYLARRGTPVEPKELGRHDVLLDSETVSSVWVFSDAHGAQRITLVPALTTPNITTVARMASTGLGVARVPRMLVDQQLASGALVQLFEPFELTGADQKIWLLYSGRRFMTQTARTFVEFAAARRDEALPDA